MITRQESTAWIRDLRTDPTWNGTRTEKHIIRKELLILERAPDGTLTGYVDDADRCTFGTQECSQTLPLSEFPLPPIERLADLEGPEVDAAKLRLDKILAAINGESSDPLQIP